MRREYYACQHTCTQYRSTKHIKQITDIKGEIDRNTIHQWTDLPDKKKRKSIKATEILNDTIEQI